MLAILRGRIILCMGLVALFGLMIGACTKEIPKSKPVSRLQAGGSILLAEAERLLISLKEASYTHHTFVDEAKGKFQFDCSGFLVYALGRVLPESLASVNIDEPNRVRPLAEDFHTNILKAGFNGNGTGWKQIRFAKDLLPGDIIVWLRPPDSPATDTGHVMIIRDQPHQNPARATEVLIQVIDSTRSPHADDTRCDQRNGLGSGLIGMAVDQDGLPTGFYWRGNKSRHPKNTHIVFGRID